MGWLAAAALLLGASARQPLPLPRPRPAVHTVALSKQYVPVHRGGRTVAHKTAYFGSVFVGLPRPQHFTVLFDTGSGHLVLPSVECGDACAGHRRYDRALSSAVSIDFDGTRVDPNADELDEVDILFGMGSASGPFAKDVVCLGNRTGTEPEEALRKGDCVPLRVVSARKMTRDPFEYFTFDGIVGLGLESLALHHEFSFVGQMRQHGQLKNSYFGVFLANSGDQAGEISFGGHNEERITTPLSWAPVASPELGYWQVELRSVTIGNTTVDLCADGGCRAVLDTGTSMLGVPKQVAASLHWALARPVPGADGAGGGGGLDCRHLGGPRLVFDLGPFSLSLEAEDYSRPAPGRVHSKSTNQAHNFCLASLLPVEPVEPLGPKTFIFGEPVLRRHYTAYDWHDRKIGFALARQPQARPAGGAPLANGAPAS